MSNRNKKSPMFVSNINTDYEFADYTEPNATQSAFGNPNQQRQNQESPQTNSAFKKNDQSSNNWFEEMLQTQKQTTLTSPRNIDHQSQRSPEQIQGNTFQQQVQNQGQIQHVSQYQQYPQQQEKFSQQFSQNNNFEIHTDSRQSSRPQDPRQNYQQQNQQEPKFSPSREFNNEIHQLNKPFAPQNFETAVGVNERSGRSYQNLQGNVQTTISERGNPNNYQYKAKIETIPNQNQNGSNFSYSEEINYSTNQLPSPKSKHSTEPQFTSSSTSYSNSFSASYNNANSNSNPNSNSNSNSNSGLTDESIIDCLPEPARSNILAMIRRSKGQA